jgi:hypothetical protein
LRKTSTQLIPFHHHTPACGCGPQGLAESLQEAHARLADAAANADALEQQRRDLVAQLYGADGAVSPPTCSWSGCGSGGAQPLFSPDQGWGAGGGQGAAAREGLFQRAQRLAAALARSEAATAEAALGIDGARREVAEAQAQQRAAAERAVLMERQVSELRQLKEAAEARARDAAARVDDLIAARDRAAAEVAERTAAVEHLKARLLGVEAECARALAATSAEAAARERADVVAAAAQSQVSELQAANAELKEQATRGAAQLAAARVKMEVGVRLGTQCTTRLPKRCICSTSVCVRIANQHDRAPPTTSSLTFLRSRNQRLAVPRRCSMLHAARRSSALPLPMPPTQRRQSSWHAAMMSASTLSGMSWLLTRHGEVTQIHAPLRSRRSSRRRSRLHSRRHARRPRDWTCPRHRWRSCSRWWRLRGRTRLQPRRRQSVPSR